MTTNPTNNNGVTGISETGARNIKNAVYEYRRLLKRKSNDWLDPAGIGKRAISGTASLKNFDQMMNYFMQDNIKYINYLQQFENKMDEILNRYKSADNSNKAFTSVGKRGLN